MKIHILDDWFDSLRYIPSFQKIAEYDVTIWNDHIEDIAILTERLKDAEVLVLFRERTKITRDLLEKLPNLHLISQRSVYPHIDIEACHDLDITVCSNMHKGTPSFAASEHVWALILAAYRQIPQQMASLQQGNWQMGVGKTLRGRTIGFYGYGRIANQVARYAESFGMNIIWWASEEGRKRAKKDGMILASSRKAFFAMSDIVSIHVRLKETTRNIITRKDFENMKKDSLFVNTSRAGLIEKDSLLHALNEGRPEMAAIDVFDEEPITWQSDPLACHPNVIATPHIGFVTIDELENQFSDIFEQIIAYHNGNPIHVVS